MLFLCAGISAATWVWLSVGHGGFWRSTPVVPSAGQGSRRKLAVVLPARNEAEHIEATLRSLLAQEVPGELAIVLVDDNSTDATSAIAGRLACADVRLRVLAGKPLPHGWTGKLWAVSQALASPEVTGADFVLLTDADVVHGAGHLQSLVSQAERGRYALVSEMVRLRCDTLAERATMPAFVFFFQMLYPFAWVGDPRKQTAAAAGGTMLVSRAALEDIGGVGGIRHALIDDVALARQIKAAGHRIWLGHGERAASERRYGTFAEVWDMIARTAYVQLGYSPRLLLATCGGMLLLYAVPVASSFAKQGKTRWSGLLGWGIMAALFQPTLRRYKRSPWWGLALPGIAVFYLGATLASAARFYGGRGGGWKGRVYAAAGSSLQESG